MLVNSLGLQPIFEGEEVDNVCYDKDNEWSEIDLRLEIINKGLDSIMEKRRQNKIEVRKLSPVEIGKGYITRRRE